MYIVHYRPFLFSGNLAICGAFVPESEFVMTLKVIKLYPVEVLDIKEVIDAPCCGTRQYSCSFKDCPKKPREEKLWAKYRPVK